MTGDRHPADAPPRDSDRDAAGAGDADPVVILPPPKPATEELSEFVATHEMTMEELLSGPPEQPVSEDPAEAPPEPPRGATPPAEPEKEPFDTVETDLSDRVQLAKASLPERPELDFPDELDDLLSGREPLFVDTVELTEDKLRAGDGGPAASPPGAESKSEASLPERPEPPQPTDAGRAQQHWPGPAELDDLLSGRFVGTAEMTEDELRAGDGGPGASPPGAESKSEASLPQRPEPPQPTELDDLLSNRSPIFAGTAAMTEDELRTGPRGPGASAPDAGTGSHKHARHAAGCAPAGPPHEPHWRTTKLRPMTAIREGIRSALKAGDPERLKALTTEARHRPAQGAVTVEIDAGGARITFQPNRESTGDEIEVETSPSEAVIADAAFNQGAPSITPEQIAAAIKALDDAGDTTELEKLRDAVDLDPVGYAADFCWWEPAQSRPGHPTWRRWTVSKDKRSSLHRDSLGTMARNIETMEKLAEKMGRRMAASPKLEATFRRLAAGVGVFLTDHDWLRAGALGLRSHQIPQQDRKLCDHALRTAAEVRTRLPEVKDLLPLETARKDSRIDASAESAWWTDVMVGALMEPETSTELAELIRDLKNARVSSVTMTDFKSSVATIIIQPTILVPAETVMGLDFTPFRTDLAHALRGMTHRMEASAGEALELQLTLDPDLSTVEVRDMLEDDDNPVLVDTEDGRAPILFPTRNDIFSSRNRYMLEKTLRAMNTRPLELMMSPNVVRRQCADAEPQAAPRGILDGISRSIEWTKRYTVRRAFMALQPDPEGNDETVLGGHPHLETGPGPGDGRLTLTLESPAWKRHGLSAPAGPVTASTALILAAQTNQQLEHGPLQTAVDQLVWSDNIEEIERTAACLAVKPHSLVKPADADCDNDEPDAVDFGRMNGNQIVSCYHHARLMLTKSQETGAAPPGETPSGPDVPPAPGRGTPPAAA